MSTLASVQLTGLYSALPAAGIAGRMYYCTDSSGAHQAEILRDNGTSWDILGYLSPTAGGGGGGGALTLISDQTLGSPAATITFPSIAGTYKQLQLIYEARSANAGNDNLYMQANADTSTNYLTSILYNLNATVTGQSSSSASANPPLANIANANVSTNVASSGQILIPNYSSTTFYKSATASGALINGGFSTNSGALLSNWLWVSTSAITQILLGLTSGANFATGSRFSLYGLG